LVALKPWSPNFGPDLARETVSSSRKDISSIMKISYIYQKIVDLVECNIPKQSHYVRCPILELLLNSLGGPRIKKFGDNRFYEVNHT